MLNRFAWLALLWCCGAAIAVSAEIPSGQRAGFAPEKSPNDNRQYRYLELANGLRVLLVSSPEAEESAVALRVNVGSAADPEGREGLAHFLEHMLFLGTEKFPEPDGWPGFIATSGGTHNAYTALDHTLYFYTVRPAHLAQSLERFGLFFTAPLFTEAYVTREREAVNAEFQAKIKDDARRSRAVLNHFTNPNHPAGRFTVGNLNTLADRENQPVRDALIDFYQREYSANIMSLVVLGPQSLEQLAAWANSYFSAIPNKNIPAPTNAEPLFGKDNLKTLVRYQPVKELRELRLMFPIPNSASYYPEKPLTQIADLLGHEGKGSLLSALKQEGLAVALWAGDSDMGPYAGSFIVSVTLTDKGQREYTRVMAWVFAAIDLIVKDGPQAWRFDELSQLAAINFRFQERQRPSAWVQQLVNQMNRYKPADILQGGYLYERFDASLTQYFLNFLKPDNALVLMADNEGAFSHRAADYGTPYAVAPLPALPTVSPQSLQLLRLPKPNPFVPSRLQVRERVSESPVPERLINESQLRLWHMQDNQFNLPRSVIRIQLRTPAVGKNIASRAQAELYVAMVLDELNEYSYPAFLAGLGFDVQVTARGLEITVAGYNDRQGLLLTEILEALVSPRLEAARFANVRTELIRRTRNGDRQPPYIQLLQQIVPTLYQPAWPQHALADALANTGLAEVKTFGRELNLNAQADMLAYGNLLPPEARQLAALVRQQLVKGSARDLPGKLKVLTNVRGGYERDVEVNHPDDALVIYHQAPGHSLTDRAHVAMLVQSLRSPFFHQLRTEQQLGYVVFTSALPIADYPGMVLVAQSPKATPLELRTAFDGFLDSVPEWLGDSLPAHREALLAELNEKPRNLADQAGRYWTAIADAGPGGEVDFYRREALAEALKEVNAVTLRTYAYQLFDPDRRILFATRPVTSETEPVTRVTDVDAFKAEGPQFIVP